jgi:hypothetical protein
MYIPIVVKPDKMLSDSERIARDEILKSFNVHDLYTKMKQNKLNKLLNKIKIDITDTTNKKIQSYNIIKTNTMVLDNKPKEYITNNPVYFYGLYGGSSIIGFMIGRKFQKIQSKDYEIFAISKDSKDILENEKKLIYYLNLKFGAYFNGFYE